MRFLFAANIIPVGGGVGYRVDPGWCAGDGPNLKQVFPRDQAAFDGSNVEGRRVFPIAKVAF